MRTEALCCDPEKILEQWLAHRNFSEEANCMATVTIEDPWLGSRTFDDTPEALVRDQLKLLRHFLTDGRTPAQKLLDDIAAYEMMLEKGACKEYLEWKQAARLDQAISGLYQPRLFAKMKGWGLHGE